MNVEYEVDPKRPHIPVLTFSLGWSAQCLQLSLEQPLLRMTHFFPAFLSWLVGLLLHLQKYQTSPCTCPHFCLKCLPRHPSTTIPGSALLEPTWTFLTVPKPRPHPQPSSPASPVLCNWQNCATKTAQIMPSSPQQFPLISLLPAPSLPTPFHPSALAGSSPLPSGSASSSFLLFLHLRGPCRDLTPSIC